MNDTTYLDEAIELAHKNTANGGRPFGALLVMGNKVIARAVNQIDHDHDPTAHAELLALRKAAKALKATKLDGATVYASGQPCPMCLAAMHLAGVARIVYGYSNENGEAFGLSTKSIATELSQPLEQQQWALIEQLTPDDAKQPKLYQSFAAYKAQNI